jgi:hypothetical protein
MTANKTPVHLWIIGIVSLLWNAGGVMSYLATETGNLAAFGMPDATHGYFYSFPDWAVAVWALGVWGAFAGSILLLLRSRFALWSFAISVVGLIGTTYYERVVADIPEALNTSGNQLLAVAIWVITLFLTWYAWAMTKKGVLR